jgi:hypothetical protein
MAGEQPGGHQPRMTLSNVVERLTERRGSSSTVAIKTIATGPAAGMPSMDVNITADTSWEQVRLMIEQAVYAYTELYAGALGAAEVAPKLTGVPRSSKAAK